jgi:hypothetical protein
VPDADRIPAENAASPIHLTNGRVTLQVADGKIRVWPPGKSELAADRVIVGEPLMGLFWPSKEEHDRGAPGEVAVCGYSRDAEIPSRVARRLQLVDALMPLPDEPGVWIVPIERIVLGLVREASAKGISDPAEVEAYVTRGLAGCRSEVEPDEIRRLIGGATRNGGSLSVTAAARLAGVSKGTMSRWRERYGLAAGDGACIDATRLATFQETHQVRRRSNRQRGRDSQPSAAPVTRGPGKQPPTVREVVWRFLRCVGKATREEIVSEVQKALPGTMEFEIQRVLNDHRQFRLHPGKGSEPSYYMLCDD